MNGPGFLIHVRNGTVHPLVRASMTIGRLLRHDISVRSRTVSRFHAALLRGSEGIRIFDLNSKSGVLVNGKPVKDHLLQEGDRIDIGGFPLRFTRRDPRRRLRFRRKRRVRFAAAASILCLAAALGAIVLLSWPRPAPHVTVVAPPKPPRATEARATSARLSLDPLQPAREAMAAPVSRPVPPPPPPKPAALKLPPLPAADPEPEPEPPPIVNAAPPVVEPPPPPDPIPPPPAPQGISKSALLGLDRRLKELVDEYVSPLWTPEGLLSALAEAGDADCAPAVDLIVKWVAAIDKESKLLEKMIQDWKRQRSTLSRAAPTRSLAASYEREAGERHADLLEKRIAIAERRQQNMILVRTAFADTLAAFRSSEAIDRLLHHYSSLKSDDMRKGAARAIAGHAEESHAKEIVERFTAERAPEIREILIRAFAGLNPMPAACAELLSRLAVNRKNPESLRLAAIRALPHSASPPLVRALAELMTDPNPILRFECDTALRRITGGDPQPTLAGWREWIAKNGR